MRLLPPALVVALAGCTAQPTSAPNLPREPVDVAWRTLVRDRQTAGAYAGRVVRFRLERADCAVEGKTIRVWYADRNVPPTLLIHATEVPAGAGPFTVVGTCGAPVADGIKRALRIDFYLEITAATVTPTS